MRHYTIMIILAGGLHDLKATLSHDGDFHDKTTVRACRLDTEGTNSELDSLRILWALAGVEVPMGLIFFGGQTTLLVEAVQKL